MKKKSKAPSKFTGSPKKGNAPASYGAKAKTAPGRFKARKR